MSFSSTWLALREPIDHAARSQGILEQCVTHFSHKSTLNISDIGSGTGSTVRAMSPALPHSAFWNLIDIDDSLMAVAKQELTHESIEYRITDLNKSLDAVFAESPDLVTTSAFLDLVSEQWLIQFVNALRRHSVPFYAALTYDGRAGCTPQFSHDETVLQNFNEHQKTDKGFGPALGPDASDATIEHLQKAGFEVYSATSDWQADAAHPEFQKMLLSGWCEAATEISPSMKETNASWLSERFRSIENSDATVFVGHKDIFAVPA